MQPVNNTDTFQLFEETQKVGNKNQKHKTLSDQIQADRTAMFDTIFAHIKDSEAKDKFLIKKNKNFFQKIFQKIGVASPPPKKKRVARGGCYRCIPRFPDQRAFSTESMDAGIEE